MAGWSQPAIKEQGRWVSDASLRVYLDRATTLRVTTQIPQVMPIARHVLSDFQRFYPWWFS
eukprot:2116555-Alexandrium_andersonii.AAC.1